MYQQVKRMGDILAACLLIVFLGWIFLLIVLSYLLFANGSVFFGQQRIGRGDSTFKIVKFRTLLSDTNLPVAQRKFALGNFLRATSLDELPQVWNILKGEMSLVGPRPLPVEYLAHMSAELRQRHQVRPGLTGLAQVKGRHEISWNQKFEFDLYYVKHVSFLLDISIILKTAVLLLSFHRDRSLDETPFAGIK